VLVNGLPAALTAIAPHQISFFLPWEVAGDWVILRVERDGVVGPAVKLPLRPALPHLWNWDGEFAIAFAADGSLITTADPIRPGERIELIAVGLGRLEPPPGPGQAPGATARPLHGTTVTVAGLPAEVTEVRPLEGQLGIYALQVQVPSGVPAGPQPLRLTVAGQTGTPVVLPFQP
ncbi:MAG: hypothetical protein R3310_10275, partial [Candidatus Competibacteraceae bacterium]|nr:hypothetical protein [Candidatus Competibacteraceae bacterium]